MLKLTANRETLIHSTFEQQDLPERRILGNSIPPMILLWIATFLLLCAENAQSEGILKIPD